MSNGGAALIAQAAVPKKDDVAALSHVALRPRIK